MISRHLRTTAERGLLRVVTTVVYRGALLGLSSCIAVLLHPVRKEGGVAGSSSGLNQASSISPQSFPFFSNYVFISKTLQF